MNKIKRSDKVVIIAGRDKGKSGIVKKTLHKDRLIVSGVNLVKRHIKANPSIERKGGIIEKESAIHRSNVAILNKETGKADRIGFLFQENGDKVRIFKSTQKCVDV